MSLDSSVRLNYRLISSWLTLEQELSSDTHAHGSLINSVNCGGPTVFTCPFPEEFGGLGDRRASILLGGGGPADNNRNQNANQWDDLGFPRTGGDLYLQS
eukprot:PhF_6_TR28686/c0_g1_i2/m.42152